MKTGVVSVTFRNKTPEEIIELTRKAGLDGVEWGSDVHATDEEAAARIREAMGDLETLSLGSYYRLGAGMDIKKDLAIAKALGAPNIRIWAGTKDPADTSEEERAAMVEEMQATADLAAAEGITLSFECHGGTLTSRHDSYLRLLEEIDRPNVKAYWQPPYWLPLPAEDPAVSLAHIKELGEKGVLFNIHVYEWIKETEDLRSMKAYLLKEGREHWAPWLAAAAPHAHAALLEFVKDNSEEAFLEDARTLREMVTAAEA